MAIQKAANVKLVIQPVIGIMVHEYVFEGPCRFGAACAYPRRNAAQINGRLRFPAMHFDYFLRYSISIGHLLGKPYNKA